MLLWANRSDDRRLLARLVPAIARLDPPVTVALLVVLGSGIWLVLDGPWSFGDPWVAIGLGGYAAGLAWGARVVEPEMKRLTAIVSERGPEDPEVTGRRLAALLQVDLAVYTVIVLGMTLKPQTGSAGFWAAAGAILGASGVLAARTHRSPLRARRGV